MEKFSNKKNLSWAIVIVVIIVGGFIGYRVMHKSAPVVEDKVVYVKALKVSEANGDMVGSYPGVLKGRYETNLSFQVGGKIVSKYVEMGKQVHAGEVLMALDQKDLRDTVASADAQVQAAKSQLELATTTVERYRKLYRENAVPAQTLDQMEANYKAARANYNNAVAQANRGNNALNYTELRAPGNGVIAQVMGEIGQVVGAGQPVMVFVQDGSFVVEIAVPENRLSGIKLNAPVKVYLWSDNKVAIDGHIIEVAPMADPATRSYKVKIGLDTVPSFAKLGMTAKVVVDGAKNTGVVLPLSAIYQVGDTPNVWVVTTDKDGISHVHLQKVSVKGLDEDHVEVQGIDPDATVVVAGVNKLMENQRVDVLKGDK